jgi:hypothetical protein
MEGDVGFNALSKALAGVARWAKQETKQKNI